MISNSPREQFELCTFLVMGADKTREKTLKTFFPPYDFSSKSSACSSVGSCAELVSMPTNEPSSLIVDSWLQTPIRAPSLQLCVHVYDFKCTNVLFTRLELAVNVHARRISLPSGHSNTFRCCAGSNEDRLCHEGHPGQGTKLTSYLQRRAGWRQGKHFPWQKTMLLASQVLYSLTHFKQAKGYGSKNSRGKITVYYSYLSIFSSRLSLNLSMSYYPLNQALG